MSTAPYRRNPAIPVGALRAEDCRLDDLLAILDDTTDLADYPTASAVEQGVLRYDGATVRATLAAGRSAEVEAELARAWAAGPGIVVLTGAFEAAVIDRVTTAYDAIIKQEKETGGPKGDHFGEPGANDRIWNALEKLAVRDPEAFVAYYSNALVALGARAWLGPGYQVTAQANVVRPGGKAQTVHRDYHLGFMDSAQAARYPAHVHALSAVLTLQGAVALPDALIDDGILDTVVVCPSGVAQWVGAVWTLARGADGADSDAIARSRGDRIRIEVDPAQRVELDGDGFDEARTMEITIDPGALIVRVPRCE